MDINVIFNLIIHYFLQFNIRKLNLLTCWSIEERAEFLNIIKSEYIFLRILRPTDNIFEKIINGLCAYENRQLEGFVFDYSCKDSLKVLEKLTNSRCFTLTHYWLIYGMTNNTFVSDMENKDLSIDAHITYAISKNLSPKQPVQFALYDVYNNGQLLGGQLNVTYDKTLECTDNLDFPKTNRCRIVGQSNLSLMSFFENRRLMADLTMKMETVVVGTDINQSNKALMEHFNSDKNTHINNVSRYGYRLVLLLQDIFGYKAIWYHRNIWTENYTSGGILTDLELERIDQASAPFILEIGRLRTAVIVFIGGSLRTAFLFQTPEIIDFSGERFTKPFTLAVWLSIVGLIIGFSFGLRKVFILERKLNSNLRFIPSYASTMLASFGIMCQQSSYILPKTSGGRLPYLLLLIACFVVYNYYTSLIVAFLLGSPVKSNIKRLDQLIDSNLEIGLHDVPYMRTFLNYTLPNIVKFKQRRIIPADPNKLWIPPEQGILKARKPGYAYHCDVTIGYIFVEKFYDLNEICDLNEVDMLSQKFIAMLIRKGSPYTDIFRTKYIWMLETGLVSKHHRYWFKKKPPCLAQNVIQSVGFAYVVPVFLVLIIGFGVSLFILFVEILLQYLARKGRLNGKK